MGLLDVLFSSPETRRERQRYKRRLREQAWRARQAEQQKRRREDTLARRRIALANLRDALAAYPPGSLYGHRTALIEGLARRHRDLPLAEIERAVTRSRVAEKPARPSRARRGPPQARHARPGRVDDSPTQPLAEGTVRAVQRADLVSRLVKLGWRRADAERAVDEGKVAWRNPRSSALLQAAALLASGGRARNPALLGLLLAGAAGGVGSNLLASHVWEHPAYRPVRTLLRGARPNPAHLHVQPTDPTLAALSRRFHGTDVEVVRLDPDQRRAPPAEVVLLGEEVATAYRPHRHSQRGGTVWEHQAGDRGAGKPSAPGRRLIVADREGRVYTVPGTSRLAFDPEEGMVG